MSESSAKTALLKHLDKKAPASVRIYARTRLRLLPMARIAAAVPKGRVLEVGCGYGILLCYLHFNGHQEDLVGCDIDADKIAVADEINPDKNRIHFISDFSVQIASGTIDTIILSDVLYLMPDGEKEKLIRALLPRLKSGGLLLIKTTDPSKKLKFAWTYGQEVLAVNVLGWTKSKHTKIHFLKDLKPFKEFLTSLGMTVEERPIDAGYAYPHTLLICRKK